MTLLTYKKARIKYTILNTFEAGLSLSGSEVKSLRNKQGKLDGARVIVRGGEAFIIGMHIPPYQPSNTPDDYDPDRTRKILLTKAEIAEIADAEERKGLTVVPIEVYTSGRLLKVRIAVVRGSGKSDKRERLKRKDAELDMERAMRGKA